jgi:large conductance mechanosensitive channel
VCCNAVGIGGSSADSQRGNPDVLREFKDFINKGNVVTIAVGLVMALYFQKIVDAVLDGVINPLIAALFGESNFTDIGFDVGDARVSIGLVIDAIISFIAVAFFLFLVVKAYNKYAAKPEEEVSSETELSVLQEIRDSLANR